MSFVNRDTKEIHCKIVYYGPSLGGKTTNLQWVYHKAVSEEKSDLVSLPGDVDRTLFLIFSPSILATFAATARFHLYTVPGQVVYEPSRKLILKGLDGIIFVADSQAERMDENIQSLVDLEKT